MYQLVEQQLGDVRFKLREHHDFNWLQQLGHVFTVFSEQDSGNISFGIKIEGKKYFIKYAGAKTECYDGLVIDAIHRLKAAQEVYESLSHPVLITYIKSIELAQGLALMFEWVEGECYIHIGFMQVNESINIPILHSINIDSCL